MSFERTPQGVSTQVYRVRRGNETYYLRLAESTFDDMAPEVDAHRRLLALGVRVPQIVHYERFDGDIGRSVAITTEIRGTPLDACTDPNVARRVVRDAGNELALFNSLDVHGFGWVLRDAARWPLHGEHPTWASWVTSGIRPDASILAEVVFDDRSFASIERVIDEELARTPGPSRLVHGDFDTSPIFFADRTYTGIIDLGEIRGAEAHYDLAHFRLHDTTSLPFALFDELVRGYAEVEPLADDLDERTARTGALIAVFRLTRAVTRLGDRTAQNAYVSTMATRVRDLLAIA